MSWKPKFTLCKRSMVVGLSFGIAIGIGVQIMIQQFFG